MRTFLRSLTWTALGSRFARRMFLLFVLASLIPLAVIGLTVHYQYQQNLDDSRQTMLRQSARDFGQAVLDRLLIADRSLDEWWSVRDVASLSLLETTFSHVSVVDTGGARKTYLGAALDHRIPDHWWETDRVRIASLEMDGWSQVFLVKGIDRQQMLLAAVKPQYLWEPAAGRPAGVNLLVLTTRSALFESVPIPRQAMPGLLTGIASGKSDHVGWEAGKADYTGIYWELFLRSRFEGYNWHIVAASEGAANKLLLSRYSGQLTTVTLLTLLFATLLSSSQIRRYLNPLEKLIDATKDIAGHRFERTITIRSGDEFEELGNAINDMSQQLGRQFSALTTLSEIDATILEEHDLREVVKSILSKSLQMLPAKRLVAMVNDDEVVNRMQMMSCDESGRVEESRIQLSADTLAWIADQPTESEGQLAELPDELALALKSPGKGALLAVSKQFKLQSLLLLAPAKETDWDQKVVEQARNVNQRLAVALTAVERQQELFQQANYDALTGLPNRQLLNERLERKIVHAKKVGAHFAVMFIDLDHFKVVNDGMGHSAGDELLKEIAQRIEGCIEVADTVARLGGDEFVVLIGDVQDINDIEMIAARLQQQISLPVQMDGRQHQVSASLGVALYPADGDSAEVLLRNADAAMYQAKDTGRGRAAYFEQSMNDAAVERLIIKEDLHAALAKNVGLTLHYQPMIEFDTGKVCGAEALIRWNHPELGFISPDRFIGVAEATGLIDVLDRWVFRRVCIQLNEWGLGGVEMPYVSVNVSGREIVDEGYVPRLLSDLTEYGIGPEQIRLEVTETALIKDLSRTAKVLEDIRSHGIKVAIDDFGTGYSSLSYVQDLPADTLKIDKSFVDRLDGSNPTKAAAIISTVVHLAEAMNQMVVAEGVEELAQAAVLQKLGCHVAQGYLYAKPMCASDLATWLSVSRMGRYAAKAKA